MTAAFYVLCAAVLLVAVVVTVAGLWVFGAVAAWFDRLDGPPEEAR